MKRILIPALLCYISAVHAEDRALLIGINQYEHTRTLKGTHNDVEAMQSLLYNHLGFKTEAIKVLKDNQANKASILQALDDWLINDSKPGDHIVFYYSGHGDQLPDQSGDEQDGMDEALIPFDADSNGKNWILDDEIATRMQQLANRQVLAVFDSCHSGTVTRGVTSENDGEKVPEWEDNDNRSSFLNTQHAEEGGFIEGGNNIVALFAVAPNQSAIDDRKSDPKRPHGVFTDAVVNGIQQLEADANQDGSVSFNELLAYSREQSVNYCRRFGCNGELTPVLDIADSKQGESVEDFTRSSFVNVTPEVTETTTTTSPTLIKPKKPLTETVSSVLVQKNHAKLQLNMLPATTVHLSTAMTFTVNVPKAGNLVLFDVSSDNKVTQLYPNNFKANHTLNSCNSFITNGKVPAHSKIVIPDENCMNFEIVAQEPIGKG